MSLDMTMNNYRSGILTKDKMMAAGNDMKTAVEERSSRNVITFKQMPKGISLHSGEIVPKQETAQTERRQIEIKKMDSNRLTDRPVDYPYIPDSRPAEKKHFFFDKWETNKMITNYTPFKKQSPMERNSLI